MSVPGFVGRPRKSVVSPDQSNESSDFGFTAAGVSVISLENV